MNLVKELWAKRPWRPGRKGTRFPNGIPRVSLNFGCGSCGTSRGEDCDHFTYMGARQFQALLEELEEDLSTKPFSPVVELDLTDDEIKKFYGEL